MADNLSLTLIDIRILECHELLSTHIATLNKKSLKNIASYLSDEILRLPCHFKYIQWYHIELDSNEWKLYKPDPPKIKRKPPENICHITFRNKSIAMTNLPAIFNSTNIQPGLVTNKCNFIPPSVINDLNVVPICFKLFTLTILCHFPWLYSPFPVYLIFEHAFTDKYLGTIQADRKDVFTFTLSASKYSFFL